MIEANCTLLMGVTKCSTKCGKDIYAQCDLDQNLPVCKIRLDGWLRERQMSMWLGYYLKFALTFN